MRVKVARIWVEVARMRVKVARMWAEVARIRVEVARIQPQTRMNATIKLITTPQNGNRKF